jgi:hypothetical protein
MARHVGYDDEGDLACDIQGLWRVVCQPLVVWLCVNPRSYVPFNELILGCELGSTHRVNRMLMLMNLKCMMLSA